METKAEIWANPSSMVKKIKAHVLKFKARYVTVIALFLFLFIVITVFKPEPSPKEEKKSGDGLVTTDGAVDNDGSNVKLPEGFTPVEKKEEVKLPANEKKVEKVGQ